jgi:hypothetical protein
MRDLNPAPASLSAEVQLWMPYDLQFLLAQRDPSCPPEISGSRCCHGPSADRD